jgi:hypothetical protein
MSSDWKKRAIPIPVDQLPSGGSSWKSRAIPFTPTESKSTPPPISDWEDTTDEKPRDDATKFSGNESMALGAGQGVTAKYGDELYGGMTAAQAEAKKLLELIRLADKAKGYEYGKSNPTVYSKKLAGPDGTLRTVQTRTETHPSLSPEDPIESSVLEEYRGGRDVAREQNKSAKEQNTGKYALGEVGGDVLLQTPLAIASGGASLSPVGQAIIGGASALGASDDDLTFGGKTWKDDLTNYIKAADQTNRGAVLGYLTGKAGEKLSLAAKNNPLTEYFGKKAQVAVADEGAAQSLKALKGVRSAVAELGGRTSTANRSLDVLAEILDDPTASAADKAAAEAFLTSEEGAALKSGVHKNTLGRIGGELGRLNTAEELLAEANAGTSKEALDKAVDEGLSSPFKKTVMPRVMKYASRFIPTTVGPAVGLAVGNQFGSPALGAGVGMLVGGGIAATMGHPGTAIANMAKSPAFRKMAWDGVQKALIENPAKLGRFGPVIARELQAHGEDAALAMHESLLNSFPEYSKQLEFVLGGFEPAGAHP